MYDGVMGASGCLCIASTQDGLSLSANHSNFHGCVLALLINTKVGGGEYER